MTKTKRKRPSTGRGRSSRPAPQRSRPRTCEPSFPEIQTRYAAAGRETLAAIAQELTADGLAGLDFDGPDCGPEIEIGQVSVGRETMAAIQEELAPRATPQSPSATPPPRPRLRTAGFSEPPPDERDRFVGLRPGPGRTSAAEHAEQTARTPARAASGGPQIFEMATFVVRGDLTHLASSEARRTFVGTHLIHRLPVSSMDAVDRVDVTPWTVRGTVVLRVWCRVPPPS